MIVSWTWFLGIALLLWVAWDLFAGSSWLHRRFERVSEPGAYWGTLGLWTAVAISCFFW